MTETWVEWKPSNGTAGELWFWPHCRRCQADHDGGFHDEPVKEPTFCEVQSDMLIGKGRPEWQCSRSDGRMETRCTSFVACGCEGDGL